MIYLFCGDFSLNRPGIATLAYDDEKFHRILECFTEAYPMKKEWTTERKLTLIYDWLNSKLWNLKLDHGEVILVRERHAPRAMWDAMAIGKVLGVADLTADLLDMGAWTEYAPNTIKGAVTGNGRADKNQVAKAVTKFTGVKKFKYDDESDAVAVGITWLMKNGYKLRPIEEDEETDA